MAKEAGRGWGGLAWEEPWWEVLATQAVERSWGAGEGGAVKVGGGERGRLREAECPSGRDTAILVL